MICFYTQEIRRVNIHYVKIFKTANAQLWWLLVSNVESWKVSKKDKKQASLKRRSMREKANDGSGAGS